MTPRVEFYYEGRVAVAEEEGGYAAPAVILSDAEEEGWSRDLGSKLLEHAGYTRGGAELGRVRILIESLDE